MHRSKSKPEIEFQYDGRPFFETGSSYISAVESRPNLGSRYISTFLWVMLDHARSAIVGLKLVLQFGLDPIYRFTDIAIFIFWSFALKLRIHAHFFFGGGGAG